MLRPEGGAAMPGSWQELLDEAMASCRVSVEWGFGKIMQLWAFLDHAANIKCMLQPVGLYYPVANILTNMHSCLYGSQTGSYFRMQTPTLEDYASGRPLCYSRGRFERPVAV